ncbi:MAG: DNA replication/repair protein RecF [Calditrichaceae bacterium]
MHIKNLKIENFRNILNEEINFDKNINIIYGENGQGKTSILEAIYFLAITRSFRINSEKIALQKSKEYFDLNGRFTTDANNEVDIRLFFSLKDGKNVFLNKNKLQNFSELIGVIPTILLSLEDLELTYGVPANRRRFVDILLAQTSPVYLHALQKYKKSLQHRNKLLTLINEGKSNKNALFPWDEQLISNGIEIVRARQKFIDFINKNITGYYRFISKTNEEISGSYVSNISKNLMVDKEEIKNQYHDNLSGNLNADIERKSTSIGPHRDDFNFLKDGNFIKYYGSQGENKTFLIALKFVESSFLKQNLKENPVFLMDDIFGELDDNRIASLLDFTKTIGQTFITTTLKTKFKDSGLKSSNYICLKNGTLMNAQ